MRLTAFRSKSFPELYTEEAVLQAVYYPELV